MIDTEARPRRSASVPRGLPIRSKPTLIPPTPPRRFFACFFSRFFSRLAPAAFLILLILLTSAVFSSVPVRATESALPLTPAEQQWITSHPVVRVGVSTEFPPYYFSNERGRYEGFVIDLMDRLARRAGLAMEYVRFERFGDTLQALRERRIDVTPFTSESASRREYLRFVRPLFSTQMVYVADRALGDVNVDAHFSGYRVAVEELSTAADLMHDRFPTARVLEYKTSEQAILATASGAADIFLGFRQVAVYYMEKHLTANLALRGEIATPGTALGPAVRRDLPELAGILEKAINDLTLDEIGEIASRWLPRSVLGILPQPRVQLSEAQRAWVRDHGHLRLGFDASFAPITFTNLAGGFDGLAADITRAIAKKAGLIVAFEQGGSFEDVFERAGRGDLDVVVAAARNPERSLHFDFVGPFLRVPSVIVAATDRDLDAGLEAPDVRTLALLKSHFLIPRLQSSHPYLTLRTYDTQAEVLDAVRRGEADLAIGNMKVVDQLIEARHSGALRVIGTVPQGDSELYFAVRKSLPELTSVLSVALDSLTPAERTAIESRWLRVQWAPGVPWRRVLISGAAALCLTILVVGSFWYSNRRLRQAHANLMLARGLADEQVAVRASFIAYLSHELRGTLGGIAAALELVPTRPGTVVGDREHVLVDACRDSANGLLDLCERSLDLERMIEGGVDLRLETVLMDDVIARAVAPWRVQAQLKGLELRVVPMPEADSMAECDPVRLTQIIQNLVGNAVKFTRVGQILVVATFEGTGEAAASRLFRLRVSDTGPGIADDDRRRLFQPFAQGGAGRTLRRGAGLGLSIAARIAQAMGGSVTLESTSPKGSVFVLLVPMPRPEEVEVPDVAYAAVPEAGARSG